MIQQARLWGTEYRIRKRKQTGLTRKMIEKVCVFLKKVDVYTWKKSNKMKTEFMVPTKLALKTYNQDPQNYTPKKERQTNTKDPKRTGNPEYGRQT